ncbi:fibronectin type III domain-containing protein [Archangium sp.]|uniref:fibronectin type III domain-containing protein n=1 Tax=Archangium sp. TaxID=1872627 RepID=UPI003899D4D2
MSARISRGAILAATLVPFVLAALLTPSLARAWSPSITSNTYLGGRGGDELQGVVTNDQGQVFVVGQTGSDNFPGGAGLSSLNTNRDVLVGKFENGTLTWSRAFGGDGDDTSIDVRLVPNTSGQEVYVVGTIKLPTSSVHTTPGSSTVSPVRGYQGGTSDAFLARVNAQGQLRWLLYLGGAAADEGSALAVSPDGSKVYVGGRTTSAPSTFSPAAAGKQGSTGSVYDGFVTQVDVSNADNPVAGWTRVFGTIGDDALASVVFMNDALYVGGTVSADIVDTDASFATLLTSSFHGGKADGFVAKLEKTGGGVVWFNNVGTGAYEEVYEVLAAPSNTELIVVGITDSPAFIEAGSASSKVDIVVFRMSSAGDITPGGGHRLSGDGNERMSDKSANLPGQSHATLDALGNVYISGRTSSDSTDGFAVNAFDSSYADNTSGGTTHSDGFVAMVDSTLSRTVWASYVGGTASSDEWVLGVSAGPEGKLTFVGYSDADDVLPRMDLGGYDISPNGLTDGVLMSLDVDRSGPIFQGQVSTEVSAQGTLSASWVGFSDPETLVSGYQWAVTPSGEDGGVVVEDGGFKSVESNVTAIPPEDRPTLTPGKTYVVTVRAFNGVGVSSERRSDGVTWQPPDGGIGNTPGETGSPGEVLSPLGWGCASTGGGAMAGALGLVAVTLLSVRRMRRGGQ